MTQHTEKAMADRAEWDKHEESRTYSGDVAGIVEMDTSRRFHNLMDAAMLVSHYKYGKVADGYPNRVDAIKSLKARLAKYAKSGNVELLVDIANFAMIEFMRPRHPSAHYKATDSSESAGRVMVREDIYGTRPQQTSNRDAEGEKL